MKEEGRGGAARQRGRASVSTAGSVQIHAS